jgi:sodium-dependent dicarboxylate transporter 2/3/5
MTEATAQTQKATGYDRYINWKLFSIPLGLLILILLIPTPRSMLQVGAEYTLGSKYVREYLSKEVFQEKFQELNRWQSQMILLMEASVDKASFSYKQFMKRNVKWAKKARVDTNQANLKLIMQKAASIAPDKFEAMLKASHKLKKNLPLEKLSPAEMKQVKKGGFYVKVAVATVVFVVCSFMTEAIPLPMVAFCVGIIGMLTGIFTRENVASIYWSDATWFIMGSLMFAAAFVKTGVDRRIALMMFGRLKSPSLKWITAIIIVIISPLTMFMSDHALAAMFLPIGIMLYTTATSAEGKDDPELGKILMITIAMACNLGGSLAPSGAARNIIMMSYAQEMFGVDIGFGQWMVYCVPFLFFVMPITWLVINWRFKPVITDLGPSMAMVKESIAKTGSKWTRDQKWAVLIFVVMLFCWITEKNLILDLTGIRFGIGVLAVMGAIAYILSGVVNWRDYQTKVDWGVVWLYAGAIAFGKLLTDTGGAYWIASSIVELTIPLGLGSGLGLLLSGNIIVGFITQLMADGPACAAVGPVTLAMAGIVHPGTSMIPFTTMSTAIASSLAYCLIIGTPPNAIVYASGLLEQKDYIRAGAILFFTNLAVLMLLAATYWTWLGFPGLRPY